MRYLNFLRSEDGSSLIEVAIILPTLILMLLGVVDFGRAYYWVNELTGAAQAGAVYGSQNPTDTTGMQNTAIADAPDITASSTEITGFAVAASYGCECSDGSGVSAGCASAPSCSTNTVYYVKVTATASYKPLFPWPGIPATIPMSKTVTMRSGS